MFVQGGGRYVAGLGQPAQGVVDLHVVGRAVHLGAVAGGEDRRLGVPQVRLAQAVQRRRDLVDRERETAAQIQRRGVVVQTQSPDSHLSDYKICT